MTAKAGATSRCSGFALFAWLFVAALAVLTSCASPPERIGLRVFAASSLTDVFAEIEEQFEADHVDVDVQLNVAGSASLREQALAGAPVDVIAVANRDIMTTLIEASVVRGVLDFATNELVIAVPSGNPGEVVGLDDFARDDLLIGLCAEGVPCGDLAERTLDTAGVQASIDTRSSGVRGLVTRLEADELDAALVYLTDVNDIRLEHITLPDNLRTQIRYPIAVARDSTQPTTAQAFIQFVTSERGQAIMRESGFGPR